jgi:hypothetical protein
VPLVGGDVKCAGFKLPVNTDMDKPSSLRDGGGSFGGGGSGFGGLITGVAICSREERAGDEGRGLGSGSFSRRRW